MLPIPKIKMSLVYEPPINKNELHRISSSEDAYKLRKHIFDQDTFNWTEEMILVCLNRANRVLGYYLVCKGGVSSTVCDPKVVFSTALKASASSIILMHNHPSGNLKPSAADIHLTEKIKKGAELLDIALLDHLIVSDEEYYPMSDDGDQFNLKL